MKPLWQDHATYFVNFNAILQRLCEKCSNTEFLLVRIFLYLDWKQKNTDQKKLRFWTFFTQCFGSLIHLIFEFDHKQLHVFSKQILIGINQLLVVFCFIFCNLEILEHLFILRGLLLSWPDCYNLIWHNMILKYRILRSLFLWFLNIATLSPSHFSFLIQTRDSKEEKFKFPAINIRGPFMGYAPAVQPQSDCPSKPLSTWKSKV